MKVPTSSKTAARAAKPKAKATGRRESRTVKVGYIPLLDIAVLVAAAEAGFAAREGLRLDLIREVSWANIRDRLAFHQFDVAHMLAPMPVAAMLRLGSNPSPTFTPFALGRGGNAITLSIGLYGDMEAAAGLDGGEDALANARALNLIIDRRKRKGERPLVFGMTYPFSSHNYEFRYWLGAGGIHPDRDVIMTVVPPPFTADALASGAIDGFCVNAPWNMLAVARGVGRVVAVKADIWPSSPEKVLGVRPDWAGSNAETLARLIVALDRAAAWCDVPENRSELAAMLSAYVDAPEDLVRDLLVDRLLVDPDGRFRTIPNYLTFHGQATGFPWISEALWSYSQMVRWGQSPYSPEGESAAASAYRPDLYRQALAGSGRPIPSLDAKPEGSREPISVPTSQGPLAVAASPFIDGRTFNPPGIADYVGSFDLRSAFGGHGRRDDA
jgi:ABC-type nitrate/sulfonate/bicarbonate transport system substrate-binding protein